MNDFLRFPLTPNESPLFFEFKYIGLFPVESLDRQRQSEELICFQFMADGKIICFKKVKLCL